jgi:hypothetical protein
MNFMVSIKERKVEPHIALHITLHCGDRIGLDTLLQDGWVKDIKENYGSSKKC